MNPWDLIGWAIAVPLTALSALFVYAVSVAAVRAIARRRRKNTTASDGRHLRPVN